MRRLTLAVLVLVVSVACATNPVTGKKELSLMSEAQEIAIGQQADAEIRREMGVYDDQELQRYVSDIGHAPGAAVASAEPAVDLHGRRQPGHQRLCAARAASSTSRAASCRISTTRRSWPACSVTRSATSPRAMPRSSIRVRRPAASASRCSASSCPRPLLSRTSRRWASACSSSSTAATTSSSRTGWAWSTPRERLGSGGGAAIPVRRWRASSELSERGVPNWLSTHPEPASRVGVARRRSSRSSRPTRRPRRNEDDFLRAIDGVVVGDSLEQGIVRGNAFLHPLLRFALEFPEGWEVANTAEQVMAREPGTKHFMLLQHGRAAARPRHRRGGRRRDAPAPATGASMAAHDTLGGLDALRRRLSGIAQRRGQGDDARRARRDGPPGLRLRRLRARRRVRPGATARSSRRCRRSAS